MFVRGLQVFASIFIVAWFTIAVSQTAVPTASVTTAGGVHKTAFVSPAGSIFVYLPDDMRAGDTISGTVVAEPAGGTGPERAANLDVLNGTVIDVGGGQKVRAADRVFQMHGIAADAGKALRLMASFPNARSVAAEVPVGGVQRAVAAAPGSFTLPQLGQTGRPVEIVGPFDGDASNTRCTIGGQSSQLLAEGPRKAIFQSPTGITGPTEIALNEAGTSAQGPFRNVVVNLSAPKTNLRKGEKTIVTVAVTGLQGLDRPMPLRMDTSGPVAMQGGNVQNIAITATEVNRSGEFARQFDITGVAAGNFSVVASVLVDNPAGQETKCKCVCEFANPPIVPAGSTRGKTSTQYSYAPNMKSAGCTGKNCEVSKIEYSWSIGAGSTATYTVSGTKTGKKLAIDVTADGTLELSVTVTVTCSDGSTCTATASKTFRVKK